MAKELRDPKITATATFDGVDQVTVSTTGGAGGVVELWVQGSMSALQTAPINAASDPVNFTVDGDMCYYVIAREAAPSTNTDIVPVANVTCGTEIEVGPPAPFHSFGGRGRKVPIRIELTTHKGKPVSLLIFSKKDDTEHFDFRGRSVTLEATTHRNDGTVSVNVGGFPEDHTQSLVFMTFDASGDGNIDHKFVIRAQ